MDTPDSDRTTSTSERSEMGLIAATALVMGSVVGTGVFMLPAAFAPFGPISLAGFALAAIGATTLALTFGALARSPLRGSCGERIRPDIWAERMGRVEGHSVGSAFEVQI